MPPVYAYLIPPSAVAVPVPALPAPSPCRRRGPQPPPDQHATPTHPYRIPAPAPPQKTLSAAIAVFLFNVLYEVILSRSLKQYAICPLIDLFNHSSATPVGAEGWRAVLTAASTQSLLCDSNE